MRRGGIRQALFLERVCFFERDGGKGAARQPPRKTGTGSLQLWAARMASPISWQRRWRVALSSRAGCGGQKGEIEHAAFGAELFFRAGGMPAVRETFGREDNERAACLVDGVSAGFFAGAEESAHARAAGADSLRAGQGFAPLGAVFGPRAGAAERFQHRRLQQSGVAIGKPLASGEGELSGAGEKAAVFSAEPRPFRVFANVAGEGVELAVLHDDPVVPVGFENGRMGWPGGHPARRGRAYSVAVLRGGRRAAPRRPKGIAQRLDELHHQGAQRNGVGNGFDFQQQVYVVGHDGEALDGSEATPLFRKAQNHLRKGAGDGRCHQPALPPFGIARRRDAGRGEGGEVGQTSTFLQRHHVEKRPRVVEAIQAATHCGSSSAAVVCAAWGGGKRGGEVGGSRGEPGGEPGAEVGGEAVEVVAGDDAVGEEAEKGQAHVGA